MEAKSHRKGPGDTDRTELGDGPKSGRESALLAAADRHLLKNYRPAKMVLERGRACELFDTEGRRYLDFCAGVAVCCLGHAHPVLTRVVAEQAGRAMQVSNYFYNVENVRLAEELCLTTGFDRAFFCNSGAEANEALLKLSRQHFHQRGEADRVEIIAFSGAFHGRTMGALALTGNPKYQQGFGPPLSGIHHLPYGDLDSVAKRMNSSVAAVLVEPLQGEGGVLVPPDGFLKGLRAVCDEHGALLLFDEVQVGMGRTGRMLAAEHSGVRADAVALAKGLGGGFPIGAILLREHLASSLPPGTHGSTFGGNPLASAVARAVLRVLREDDLLEAATRRGERLQAGLRELAARHPNSCRGERGLGLLRALVLSDDLLARDLLPLARQHGLLLTAAGPSALRYTPPLVVSETEIDEALDITEIVLTELEAQRTTAG